MAGQTNPIQSNQIIPAVVAQPAVDIDVLPDEMLLLILEKIFDATDVANLNLVSRRIQILNQDPSIYSIRSAARVAENEDAECVKMIQAQFTKRGDATPHDDVINFLKVRFIEIGKPNFKMEAFHTILNATNASNNISRAFNHALPTGTLLEAQLASGAREASERSFFYQMFRVNGGSVYNGVDHGVLFGQFMVDNEIRSPCARTAARRLADVLHLDAFQAAMAATTATDDSVRKAFKDLPIALRNSISYQIWTIQIASGGNDNGDADYGTNVVKMTPRDPKVVQAAAELRNSKL